MKKNKVAVLGAGSWGATIACLLNEKGYNVGLWEFNSDQAKRLDKNRKLDILPQLTSIPKKIKISSQLHDIVDDKTNIIVMVVPSAAFRNTVTNLLPCLSNSTEIILSATKGLENNTDMRMSEILDELLPEKIRSKIGVISGPSHAEEVCQKIPTAVVVSSKNKDVIAKAQRLLFTPYFRVYTNPDLLGVEFSGASKNVYAIGCGICDGLNLGDNSKAAFVTRGLAEMSRLGTKMGANILTFFGLAGIGDLVVTCYSKHSRNRRFGEKIGLGKSKKDALKEIKMVVEGITTSKVLHKLSKEYNIEMPINEQVYKMVYENMPPQKALKTLLYREAKPEIRGIGF